MLNKLINLYLYLIILSLPLYLIKVGIGWLPVNLLELLIYGLIVLWLVKIFITKQWFGVLKLKLSWLVGLGLVFVGVSLATFYSSNLIVSAGIWKSWFVVPMMLFIIIGDQIKTARQARHLILGLFGSGVAVAIISLYYYLAGQLTYDGRLAGLYQSANYLAMYLSPILILSLYLYRAVSKKIYWFWLGLGQAVILVTIYLTYSYGAWFGLLSALILIALLTRKSKAVWLFLFLILLGILVQAPSDKFQQIIAGTYPSLESRIAIYQSAWKILGNNWLIGIGPGLFQQYYLEYQTYFKPYPEWAVPQPHNLYLAWWLQAGLIGLIGFILLLITFFTGQTKNQADSARFLPVILIGAAVYILAHGLLDTPYFKNDLAIIFWLILALKSKAGHLAY